jgi:hypothetical protein
MVKVTADNVEMCLGSSGGRRESQAASDGVQSVRHAAGRAALDPQAGIRGRPSRLPHCHHGRSGGVGAPLTNRYDEPACRRDEMPTPKGIWVSDDPEPARAVADEWPAVTLRALGRGRSFVNETGMRPLSDGGYSGEFSP